MTSLAAELSQDPSYERYRFVLFTLVAIVVYGSLIVLVGTPFALFVCLLDEVRIQDGLPGARNAVDPETPALTG